MLALRPITLRVAMMWCHSHHRHEQAGRQRPIHAGLWAHSACVDGEIVGVAIVGRPKARHLDDGVTAEVVRLATDGTANACSFLYRAAWRTARAMGYVRIYTYILDSEPGTSLRAAGWLHDADTRGRQWSCPSRPRQTVLVDDRQRWVCQCSGGK